MQFIVALPGVHNFSMLFLYFKAPGTPVCVGSGRQVDGGAQNGAGRPLAAPGIRIVSGMAYKT